MLRALLFILFLALPAAYAADGPGSGIRAEPSPPQPPSHAQRSLQRCEPLSGEEKERCLKDERAADAAEGRTRGPESIGGASAVGTGATSGTSGGGTFGGSAPR